MEEAKLVRISLEEAIARLTELQFDCDPESAHVAADKVLLALIGDEKITDLFGAIEKWYA